MWRGGFEMKHTKECKEAEKEYIKAWDKCGKTWKKYDEARDKYIEVKKKCGCLE
jgi:hypothetical protein